MNFKNPPHRDLNPRPSGLQHSALTTTLPRDNKYIIMVRYLSIFIFIYLLFGLYGYWHCGHSWPIVPDSGDSEDDCGKADGM
jgi:hypothetical protein